MRTDPGLVDIEIQAVNQRGELTTPGIATVALPSRDVWLPAFSVARPSTSNCTGGALGRRRSATQND